MKNQKNLLLYVIGFVCFFSSGCNRANESTSTKISISLPNGIFANKATDSVSTTTATGGTATESEDWATTRPTSVSQFNCFIVMISGPEEILKRNSCGKKIAAGSDAFTPSLYFGPIAGLTPAGHDLEIEVASGSERVITLVGFVTDDSRACLHYNSADFDKSKLSKPYIIGKSAPVTLQPTVGNDSVTVPVALSLDSDSWFEECSGPDFNKRDGGSTPVAKIAELRKDLFPVDLTPASSCNSVQIELKDHAGNLAKAANDSTIAVKANGTLIKTYPTYSNCNNGSDWAWNFTILANQQSMQRWIKTDTTSVSVYNLALDLSATTLTSSTVTAGLILNNKDITYQKLQILGAKAAISGICYRYDLAFREIGTNFGAAGYANGESRSVKLNISNGVGYSDASCTTAYGSAGANLNIVMDNTAPAFKTIYVKYNPSETSTRFENTMHAYDANGVFGSDKLYTAVYNTSANVISVPNQTAVDGSRVLPKTPYRCYGPFRLTLQNAFKVEVPTAITKLFNVTNTVANTSIKTTCGGTTTNTLTISTGASSATFYVVSSTVSPSDGTISFTPVAGGGGGTAIPTSELTLNFN